MGIIAGLGRGMPSPRPAGGRGGRWSPVPVLGAGAGERLPMPWVDENGLLPGRGAPGRAGRGPGLKRAPSLGASPSVPSSVAAGAAGASALAAGASGSAAPRASGSGASGSALVRGPGRGAALAAAAGASAGASARPRRELRPRWARRPGRPSWPAPSWLPSWLPWPPPWRAARRRTCPRTSSRRAVPPSSWVPSRTHPGRSASSGRPSTGRRTSWRVHGLGPWPRVSSWSESVMGRRSGPLVVVHAHRAYSSRGSHRRLMSSCSRSSWVAASSGSCIGLREVLSQPVEAQAPPGPRHHAAGPGRRHVCARRVRDIRAWGADAPRDPVRCRSGRVRRTSWPGPPRPSLRPPAATHAWRLVARHPMQVRTGPSLRVEMSSCETTVQHSTGTAR